MTEAADILATLPLTGLRVIDLSWVLAGPVTGRLLADAGAEVIKVESRKRLDNTRRGRSVAAVPGVTKEGSDPIDRVPMFHNVNAGKKSIAIDLSSPAGIGLVKQLLGHSHVLVDNFAPGVMDRLGLGVDVLTKEFPHLVIVSLSGVGQQGPMRDVPAYAPTVTALAGLDSVVGYEGEPANGVLGLNLADSFAGMFAFYAVLTAVWWQRRSGKGQFIDYSEMEGICTMLGMPLMDYELNRRVMQPGGNSSPDGAPYGVFPTAGPDEWISIAIIEDSEWQAFCAVVGPQPWCVDSRYTQKSARLAAKEILEEAVAAYTRGHTGLELESRLRQAGVAAALVYNFAEQIGDQHFWDRDLFRHIDIQDMGRQVIYGTPWRLTDTPTLSKSGAPRLGEHTREILTTLLGMRQDEIDGLFSEGVLN